MSIIQTLGLQLKVHLTQFQKLSQTSSEKLRLISVINFQICNHLWVR